MPAELRLETLIRTAGNNFVPIKYLLGWAVCNNDIGSASPGPLQFAELNKVCVAWKLCSPHEWLEHVSLGNSLIRIRTFPFPFKRFHLFITWHSHHVPKIFAGLSV
jgi:hypothetical protein